MSAGATGSLFTTSANPVARKTVLLEANLRLGDEKNFNLGDDSPHL
jgi:hypothetical protein